MSLALSVEKNPTTTPFMTADLEWEMTEVMKYWESPNADIEYYQHYPVQKFDYLKGYEFEVSYCDGDIKINTRAGFSQQIDGFTGKIFEVEILKRKVGQVFIVLDVDLAADYFIRFLGSRTGVYVTESQLMWLIEKAESKLKLQENAYPEMEGYPFSFNGKNLFIKTVFEDRLIAENSDDKEVEIKLESFDFATLLSNCHQELNHHYYSNFY